MNTLRRDINIKQGSTYYNVITWAHSDGVPVDMQSYTARMQIRADYNARAELIIDATTENGLLEFHRDGEVGSLTIEISSALTEAIEVNGSVRQAVYDIEIVAATGQVTQVYAGNCDIRSNVTI